MRITAFFGTIFAATLLVLFTAQAVFSSEEITSFDPAFYLFTYSDLAPAGYTEETVENHWIQNGIHEGRQGSAVFSTVFYLQKYPDLQEVFHTDYAAALKHWEVFGLHEGRQGAAAFDSNYYLQSNADLQVAFGNDFRAAAEHWIKNGFYEGRHGVAPSNTFTENTRTGSFGRDCDLPALSSVVTEAVDGQNITTFTLPNGAVGGCTSDNISRNGAPYYERAELKQTDTLSKDQQHIISFSVKILQGFRSKRETFFQIHNWNSSYTEAAPSLMLGWNYEGLFLSLLKSNLDDHNNLYEIYSKPVSEFQNSWHQIKIVISQITDQRAAVSLLIDNQLIKSYLTTYFPERGTPHIKYGIYRPGNEITPIATSGISFSEIQIKSYLDHVILSGGGTD